MTDVVVARPRRLRQVCAASALAVAVLASVLALLLAGASTGSSVSGGTSTGAAFQPADQVAVLVFGLGVAALLLLGTRPRVEADGRGVRVRTIWRTTLLPWALVRAVRFDDGSPWATLDLADDDSVALMAVQRNDGQRAEDVVAALRALHAASRHQ